MWRSPQPEGDLLIWTDDDVLVEPDWLVEYVRAAEIYPQAVFFGGSVEPWYAVTPLSGIIRNLNAIACVFAIRMLGDSVRYAAGRVSRLRKHGFSYGPSREMSFDTSLGRSGNCLRGGDEIAVLRELERRHGPGVWVGTARTRHYIPKERLTLTYVWEWLRWDARVGFRGCRVPAGPGVVRLS